ncbi:MAG: xanthine phosphoribosyltransferase [Alphaproteobacteria bacterium]|nr:xanthine phosphoribosyltransferase [Alphaproteobacteria bacterium]MBR1756482.1 xanthine phosphoribosyltransferase [Alphaproteobacteria bacterium]
MLQSDKIFISWDEFHQDVKDLCVKIKASGEYNKIVAISRGGLLPAGIVAYELGIRNCAVINIATYVGAEHLKLDEIDHPEQVGGVDEHTLIVDDLSDKGQTFRVMRRAFPRGKYVTIYAKPVGKSEVDIFARELEDKWVVFPWDE